MHLLLSLLVWRMSGRVAKIVEVSVCPSLGTLVCGVLLDYLLFVERVNILPEWVKLLMDIVFSVQLCSQPS